MESISSDNHGIVSRFIRQKGYGFILDLKTKENYCFSTYCIVQQQPTELDKENEFNVGQQVLFDIKITQKGRRPNDPSAVNVRTIEGKPFPKIRAMEDKPFSKIRQNTLTHA